MTHSDRHPVIVLIFRLPAAFIPLISLPICLAVAGLTGCATAPGHIPETPPETTAAASPTAATSPRPSGPPTTDPGMWLSWAFFDRATGQTQRGGDTGTSNTESMIKVAIGAQYLRNLELAGKPPTDGELHQISIMIRDSDNQAAETLYRAGGHDGMLRAVVDTCGLQETTTKPGWWSETQMTPADAAGMGACIANGRICSIEWVTWLLGEMRSVRGVGRFGIIDVHPVDGDKPLAIKNGYQTRGGQWDINCLAIADNWSAAVMMRYPINGRTPAGARVTRGIEYGAQMCAQVAAMILPPDDPQPSPTGRTF